MMRPEPSSRHPLIVFLLIMTGLSGASIELGGQPAPQSIHASFPWWGVSLWGWALILGSAAVLIGMWLQSRENRLVAGVLFEQVGVATLGAAAIVYSAAASALAGWAGAFPVVLTFGFGVACLYRWWTLQRGINRARPAAEGELTDGQR